MKTAINHVAHVDLENAITWLWESVAVAGSILLPFAVIALV